MSKSINMLRTRRRDNNVKPNRRLDRKSSRGMLFENEELRLKTININAEVERGQSDIKKLKRENDQLRREIWYLRDEYDKLDKLLRDKDNEESSSSTSCSSESESGSSGSEESEAVETSQNIENVQKTNLKMLNQEFDHLSVVPEENSTENSEKNSNRASLSNENWNGTAETDIIKPDQSYPMTQEKLPRHFFSPIAISNKLPNEEHTNNQFLGPEVLSYHHNHPQFASPSAQTDYYPGLTLPSLNKTSTDVIVKSDNQNFNTLKSHSSFSNGGNLEELLNDIETISHDILKMSNSQNQGFQGGNPTIQNGCYFNDATSDIISQIQNPNVSYLPTTKVDNYTDLMKDPNQIPPDRPYKSELNVVLMPSPMQLIGVEKYRNLQKSYENLTATPPSLDNLSSASCQNLKIISEPAATSNVIVSPRGTPETFQPFVPVPPNCPGLETNLQHQNMINEQTNPFFFGNIRQPEGSELFNARYVPENYPNGSQDVETPWNKGADLSGNKFTKPEIYNSKTNLLDTAVSSDHVSSENEENLRFKTTRNDKDLKAPTTISGEAPDKVGGGNEKMKGESTKSPKLSIRRKVSIHFKGRKDKSAAKKKDKPKSPSLEKKHSFFDIKFSSESTPKEKKTSSLESKASNVPLEPKTPSGESKASTSDKKTESSSNSDPKGGDRKSRKSSSASPERKHGHKEGKKNHKKHKKPERTRNRRRSLSMERFNRERSYSICTDRSNILDHRLGAYNTYDDYTNSDRERTNSLSSCDTMKGRNLVNIASLPPSTGKIPWCGCWGNGCL